MKNSASHNENGNVLWFILVGILLLGAITILLSRSGSTVDQSSNFEQLRIKATQIMRYVNGLEQGVEQLRSIGGCPENDISFENTTEAGYTNANSPVDQSCHLFEEEGAGLEWRVLTPQTLTMSGGNDLLISGNVELLGVGTDGTRGTDLLLFIPVTQSLCSHINDHFGISNTTADITSDINTLTKYTGSFTETFELGDAAGEAPQVAGEPTGCIIDDNGEYVFYHTLIAR